MRSVRITTRHELACSHGYDVETEDGALGKVETPIFPPDVSEPDYLVLRVGGRLRPRFPIVATALVEEVDPERRLVRLRGTADDIARLPEHLPLAV